MLKTCTPPFPSRAWPGPGTRGESNNNVELAFGRLGVSTNHLIPCLIQEVYGSETNVSATKWIYFSNYVDSVDKDNNDEDYKVDINFVKDEKPSFETGSSSANDGFDKASQGFIPELWPS